MKGFLEISIVPLNSEHQIQFLIIQLSSFLFKILDPKGTKDIITQYYGFWCPGEEWKIRIALRDISTEVCLTHLDDYIESPEGVLTVKHRPVLINNRKFPFRFESEQILDMNNPEYSEWSGVLKIEKEDDDWKELKENIQEMLNKRKEEGYEMMKELEETQKTQKPALWDYKKEYHEKYMELENRQIEELKKHADDPPEGFDFLPGSEISEKTEKPKRLVQEEKKKSEKKILEKVEKSGTKKSEKSEKSEKIVQSKSLQSTQEATLENDTIRLLANCNFTKNELYPVQKVNSKRRKRVEKREKEEKERSRLGCCGIL
ncbi:unnamed protein product [Caenorhabditis nigoni]